CRGNYRSADSVWIEKTFPRMERRLACRICAQSPGDDGARSGQPKLQHRVRGWVSGTPTRTECQFLAWIHSVPRDVGQCGRRQFHNPPDFGRVELALAAVCPALEASIGGSLKRSTKRADGDHHKTMYKSF